MTIQETFQLATQRFQAGGIADAESLCRRILAFQPQNADALHLLGLIVVQCGHREQALELFRRATTIHPNQAEFHANLATVLSELQRNEEAVAAFGRAIALRPDFAQAYNNLGNVLGTLGKTDQAVACIHKALQIQKNYPQAFYNLANIYLKAEQWEMSLKHYRQALSLQPNWREAENNMCNALCALGRFDEVEGIFQQALLCRPSDPLAHWNVALTLLRRGDMERGWTEYEWRKQIPELRVNRLVACQPEWDGGGLAGRRILIYAEQGMGDSIQFARYLPLVADLGGKIVLSCQKELVDLLKNIPGVEECQPQPGWAAASFDTHCSLPSLPRLMRTTLANIPGHVPYLSADAVKLNQWKTRFAGDARQKIGIVWAGSPRHPHDSQRSIRLAQLAPLAQCGARLISLQKGDAAAQIASAGLEIENYSHELLDFTDTAALIQNLDLVITVDTAVAHLAGALGRPVWVLIPFVPDWRWMFERTDSPWYPSMRLFRQEKAGDWQPVVRRIAAELKASERC